LNSSRPEHSVTTLGFKQNIAVRDSAGGKSDVRPGKIPRVLRLHFPGSNQSPAKDQSIKDRLIK